MTDDEVKEKLLDTQEQFRQVMRHLPTDEVQRMVQQFIDKGMRNITDILALRYSNASKTSD